jgi:hypothetical protein
MDFELELSDSEREFFRRGDELAEQTAEDLSDLDEPSAEPPSSQPA